MRGMVDTFMVGGIRKLLKKLLKFFAVLSAIVVVLLVFVFVKYSNFTGYCKEVGRKLTEQELIERAGLSDKYKENPYCCLAGQGGVGSGTDDLLNMFFGYYLYSINVMYKQSTIEEINYPYYAATLVRDECGHGLSTYDEETVSEEYYNNIISSRKNYEYHKRKP